MKEDGESDEGSLDGICPIDPVVAFNLQFTSGSDLQAEDLQVRQLIWSKFGLNGESTKIISSVQNLFCFVSVSNFQIFGHVQTEPK